MAKLTLLLEFPTKIVITLYIYIYIYIFGALSILGLYVFVFEQFMLWVPYLFWGFLLLNTIFIHASYFQHCLLFVQVTKQ